MDTQKIMIDAMRALTVSANSIRFRPDLDPDEVAIYESQVLKCKAILEAHPELFEEKKHTHLKYPIIGTNPPEYIPWDMLAPHEAQALQNHGNQTLERLAERGGLDWFEVLAVLKHKRWRDLPDMTLNEAKKAVLEYVAAWEAEHQKVPPIEGDWNA